MIPIKLKCVLLVDDDKTTNFINTQLLTRANITEHIKVSLNGQEALDYLHQSIKSELEDFPVPDIIFLDINMPVMNGWEFLNEYEKLSEETKGKVLIICMLTTSLNAEDEKKAKESKYISDFLPKPLTIQTINYIVDKHFRKIELGHKLTSKV